GRNTVTAPARSPALPTMSAPWSAGGWLCRGHPRVPDLVSRPTQRHPEEDHPWLASWSKVYWHGGCIYSLLLSCQCSTVLRMFRLGLCAQISLDSEPSYKPVKTTQRCIVRQHCLPSILGIERWTLRCGTKTKYKLAKPSPKPTWLVKTSPSLPKSRDVSRATTRRKPRSSAP